MWAERRLRGIDVPQVLQILRRGAAGMRGAWRQPGVQGSQIDCESWPPRNGVGLVWVQRCAPRRSPRAHARSSGHCHVLPSGPRSPGSGRSGLGSGACGGWGTAVRPGPSPNGHASSGPRGRGWGLGAPGPRGSRLDGGGAATLGGLPCLPGRVGWARPDPGDSAPTAARFPGSQAAESPRGWRSWTSSTASSPRL